VIMLRIKIMQNKIKLRKIQNSQLTLIVKISWDIRISLIINKL